jgi:ABC-type multidrug transport system fused ATPase/permease subunit
MQRIFDLMEVAPEDATGISCIHAQSDIILKNVEFNYDQLAVLQGFNFTFTQGRKYALVGGSGCGKSTLIALLCRFYDPQAGNISIGNTDICQFNVQELRQRIALVTQGNQLFHDSIAENLRYGKLDASEQDIEAAASRTGIADHVRQLPDGFATWIGDQGVGLSGGQQQRIAIARVILKNADVIILDEATSALDSDSEKSILESLCHLCMDKTLIVISHRLSAIRDMDEIVCIDQGKVVESGKHNDLIRQQGFYWKLFKEQID